MTDGPMTSCNIRRISVFDLDRTLSRRPTYSLFLLAAAARHQPLRMLFVPAVLTAMVLHKTGLLSRKRLKELMHGLLLGRRIKGDRLASLTEGFIDRLMAKGLHAGSLAQIDKDRGQGRALVLATAAPDYYAREIGSRLGFDAAIATRYGRDERDVLARIEGPNCRGRDKLCALQSWLEAQGLQRGAIHVRVYSDDRSDVPTLEWADEPIVVNARRPLTALARKRGWKVVNWR